MSARILRLIVTLAVAASGCAAAAQDASPRGSLPGVAAPATLAPAPIPSAGPKVTQARPPLPPPASTISSTARLYIAALQRALPSHGYHPGPETGRLDKKTIAAIKAYQRDAGLPVDARSEMNLKTTLDSVSFGKPPILAR